VRPADRLGLVAPGLPLRPPISLGAALGHCGGRQDAELALGREPLPLQPLAFGIGLGVALGLLPSLGEQVHRGLRDGGDDDCLLLVVVGRVDAKLAQLVGEPGLEVGAELVDPVVQPLGVERADPPACGGDQVEHAVVDVVVRVARHRHLGQVGDAGLAVPDLQRRPGGVVHEGDPAHLARIGAVLPALALPGPADLAGHVAHGVVVGAPHCLAVNRRSILTPIGAQG